MPQETIIEQMAFHTTAPIFIVGCPRSGTTLVRSILAAHSRIIISPESHFLNYWVKQYSHLNLSSPEDFETFWQEFSTSQRFAYFDLPAAPLKAEILDGSESVSFKRVFQCLLDAYAQKMQKPRWGEKTPAHFESVDVLLDWFPQAKIIWILRDSRAVAASLMKVDWASNYAHANAYYWRDAAQAYTPWQKDERVWLLRYEDLVQQPEKTVVALCDFIDEEPEPAMLQGRSEKNVPNPHKGGWAKQHLQKTLKPIEATEAEKWRSQLSLNQIAAIEHITRPLMQQFGYEPITQSLSPGQKRYLDRVQQFNRWQAQIQAFWQNFRRTTQEAHWVGATKKRKS